MAKKKFTDLPVGNTPLLSDIIAAVQSNTTYQFTEGQLLNLFRSNLILLYNGNPNNHVAGSLFQMLWDTADQEMYLCTNAGAIGVAVWTKFGAALIDPDQGGTGVSNPTVNTLPIANGTAPFSFVGPLTNGQLLIGSTGLTPVAATPIAGTNITITPGAGSLAISATGHASFSWAEVTTTSQALSVNTGYIINNGALVTLTLPVTSALGDRIAIIGKGLGDWHVAQNAGQSISILGNVSTVGVAGYIESTEPGQSINLICTTANITWSAESFIGAITWA